jgi:hypothetical protein
MSYYEDGMDGLGDLSPGAAIPAGAQFALGFQVNGLTPTTTPRAVAALRTVVGTAFRGTLVAAGWGPAYGVPAGRLYALLQTGRALTGTDMNTVAHMITGALPSQLPGTTVTNTNFHQVGGGSGGGGGITTPDVAATVDPVTGLISALSTPTPGTIDPATGLPYTMLPPAESFFTQSVGGIPVWGLLAGGVVALGGIAYVMMGSKPKAAASAAVKANRRRRRVSRNAKKKKTFWQRLGDIDEENPGGLARALKQMDALKNSIRNEEQEEAFDGQLRVLMATAPSYMKSRTHSRRASKRSRQWMAANRRVRRNTGDTFDTKLKHAWDLLNARDIAGVKREIAELKRIAPSALEHQRVQLGHLIRSAMYHGKFLGSPYTSSSGHKSLPSKRSKKWLEMNRRAR